MDLSPDTNALVASWSLALHDKATSTRKLYAEVLRGFAKSLDGRSVLTATRRDCQTYFAEMRDRGLAQATLRSRWIALRSFYAWAAVEDEIDDNPMVGIKVERAAPPPPDMPDDTDLKLLFKVCAGRGIWERRDLAMIRLGLATGARITELCSLELRDVDLVNRIIVIRHGKGDKNRAARFDPETGAALDRYLRDPRAAPARRPPRGIPDPVRPVRPEGRGGDAHPTLRTGRYPSCPLAPVPAPLRASVARPRRAGR